MEISCYEMRVPGCDSVYYVKCDERTLKGLPKGVILSQIDRDTYARKMELGKVFFMLEYHNPLFFDS